MLSSKNQGLSVVMDYHCTKFHGFISFRSFKISGGGVMVIETETCYKSF